ncbi:MAG: tetratricopeptide repeat protein [Flavobacteriaceae bacterium]|nr:tetratricopeptide repeat protein [Flavobacteriaceae bacterium]
MFYRLLGIFCFVVLCSCSKEDKDTNILYSQWITRYNTLATVQEKMAFTDSLSQLKKKYKEVDILIDVFSAKDRFEQVDSLNVQSTNLFEKAFEAVKQTDNVGLQCWVNAEAGSYYYKFTHYPQAAPYFLLVSRFLSENNDEIDVQKEQILLYTAYFFETMGENKQSNNYYFQLLKLTKDKQVNNSAIYFAIGSYYANKKDLVEAEKYYTLSKEIALKFDDQLRYAKSLGALANVMYLKGNIQQAKELWKQDITLTITLGEYRNKMYAEIQLAKIYFDTKEYQKATEMFESAYYFAVGKTYLYGYQEETLKYLIQLAQITAQEHQELMWRRKLEFVQNFMEGKEGERVIQNVNLTSDYEKLEWELEAKKSKLETVLYQRILLISSVVVLLAIVLLVYRFYKRQVRTQTYKYEAKIMSFELAQIKSENRLKETNHNLATYQIYLSEKNEQIEKLEQELTAIKESTNEVLKRKQPQIEGLIYSHLMTEENWQLFKESFAIEQPVYVQFLAEYFPNLTESNIRIVLLQKLGLTNQETANILGITIDAVKKAKQRLKKKYETTYEGLFEEK